MTLTHTASRSQSPLAGMNQIYYVMAVYIPRGHNLGLPGILLRSGEVLSMKQVDHDSQG